MFVLRSDGSGGSGKISPAFLADFGKSETETGPSAPLEACRGTAAALGAAATLGAAVVSACVAVKISPAFLAENGFSALDTGPGPPLEACVGANARGAADAGA